MVREHGVSKLGWARCRDSVADVLRRGAWYPVLEQRGDVVVVEVRDRSVRLSRADVHVRADPPDHWSVVARTGVLRPTLGGGKEIITTYAVCPRCHYRQDLPDPKPTALTCHGCGEEAPVDWTTTC